MHVEVKDPEQKLVLSKVNSQKLLFYMTLGLISCFFIKTYSAEGRFSFTTHAPGEHLICLFSNSSAWFGGGNLRVHLDIEVGEHAVDYNEVAGKEKLTELQLRVRQLLDQVEQISKEQNYQRYREERFRTTSESTNQRVFWWSIAQLSILVCTGMWQMRHLKKFFEAKKLV